MSDTYADTGIKNNQLNNRGISDKNMFLDQMSLDLKG